MKEKLNFPGGYLPEGEMWFCEYLRRLIGAILGPHPVEALPPHPSLSYYNTSACTPSEDDTAALHQYCSYQSSKVLGEPHLPFR